MVFPDSEDIKSNLVGVFDLLDQVTETLRWADRPAGVSVRRGEAINSDLHKWSLRVVRGAIPSASKGYCW
jgi:hypothetical protein